MLASSFQRTSPNPLFTCLIPSLFGTAKIHQKSLRASIFWKKNQKKSKFFVTHWKPSKYFFKKNEGKMRGNKYCNPHTLYYINRCIKNTWR